MARQGNYERGLSWLEQEVHRVQALHRRAVWCHLLAKSLGIGLALALLFPYVAIVGAIARTFLRLGHATPGIAIEVWLFSWHLSPPLNAWRLGWIAMFVLTCLWMYGSFSFPPMRRCHRRYDAWLRELAQARAGTGREVKALRQLLHMLQSKAVSRAELRITGAMIGLTAAELDRIDAEWGSGESAAPFNRPHDPLRLK
jgi:hypothetical protein